MNHSRCISVACLGVLVGLCAAIGGARRAWAYDFAISARTEAYAYQVRRYGRDGVVLLNRRRIMQTLGLHVFNLLDDGREPFVRATGREPALLYVHGLLRFFTDFGDFAREAAPGTGLEDALEDNRFDLLLGALEGRNLWGLLDLTLGRQFDAELMDFFAYDGGRVRLNGPWRLFAEAQGGIQLDRSRPLSSAVFELDGTSGSDPADTAPAWSFGVAAGVDDPEHVDLRLAYRTVLSHAPAVPASPRESPPAIWGRDQELLFLSAGWAVPRLRMQLRGGLRYSLLLGAIDEVQLSLTQPLGRHRAQIEFLRSRPHFDGDSIFNIFAIEPYDELGADYALRWSNGFMVEARAGYRHFWTGEQEGRGTGGAVSLRGLASWRSEGRGHAADAEVLYLDGYGGRRFGGDLGGRWAFPRGLYGRRIALVGRASLTHSDGPVTPTVGALTSLALEAGVVATLLPRVNVHLLVEEGVSQLYDSAFRLLAVLDMSFAP